MGTGQSRAQELPTASITASSAALQLSRDARFQQPAGPLRAIADVFGQKRGLKIAILRIGSSSPGATSHSTDYGCAICMASASMIPGAFVLRQALVVSVIATAGWLPTPVPAQSLSWQQLRDHALTHARADLNAICSDARQINSRGQQFWTRETRSAVIADITRSAVADGVSLSADDLAAFDRGIDAAMQSVCPGIR